MTIFLASRRDGLGERLRSLVNAFALSQASQSDFKFFWPLMSKELGVGHAVRDIQNTFSGNFITSYSVDRAFMRNSDIIKLEEWDKLDDETKSKDWIVNVSQVDLKRQAPEFMGKFENRINFRESFLEIGLSSSLKDAIELAKSVDIGLSPVAVHLRAGDIIFGRFRLADRYHGKVVSLPIAEDFVKRCVTKGCRVVLFGEDESSIRYLSSRFDIIEASTLSKGYNFDVPQQAIFEMYLLSRCNQALAGSSGFASFASLIGGTKILNPKRFVSHELYVDLVYNFLEDGAADVPDLVTAFACRSACTFSNEHVPSSKNLIYLMKKASELDPNNAYYKLILAIIDYQNGRREQAERSLYQMINDSNLLNALISFVLTRKTPSGGLFCGDALTELQKYSSSENPMAALYLAVSSNALGNADAAGRFFAIHAENCPKDWQNACSAILTSYNLQ